MNEVNKKRKQSILFTMMIIISAIIIVTSVIFTIVLIEYRAKDLIEKSDDTLFMAAELSREIIGPNYHDKIDNEFSVTNEQFNKIVARNDDLCRRLQLQYLWSVLVIGDRIVFTSATHSDLTNPHSPCATFFETHSDPDSFSAAILSGLKPSFSSFKNQWGKGRMVLVPRKDARGRTYIFGASVQLTEFNKIIYRSTITSIGIGLAVMFCGLLLALILARLITLPITKLTEAADIMATGNLGIALEPLRTRELQSLSKSLDQMRQGIQNHISALRESEEKYRTLHHSMMDAFVSVDMEGSIIEYNDAYLNMLGYTPEEISKLTYKDITPEKWHALEAAIIEKQVLQKGYSGIYEKEYRRKDGTVFPAELRTTLLRDAEGAPISMWAIARDITARQQAEDSLKRSQKLLEETEKIGKVGGWEFNIDTGKQLWTEEIYNIHEVDLTYNPTVEKGINFYTPTSISIVEQAVKRAIEYNEPFDLELEIITAKGNLRYVHAIGKPDLDHRRVYGFFQDITERKLAVQKLRESEEQLRAILNATPFPIALVDVQDNDIVFWSRSALSLFGHIAPTAPDWYQIAYPDPDYRDQVIERWKPFLEIARESRETVNTGEYRVTCSDGSVRICELYATFLADSLIVTFNDITDRKQAEAAMIELSNYNRNLIEASLDPLVTINIAGHITDVNVATEKVTGCVRQELIGTNFSDYFIDSELAEAGYRRVFEKGTVRDYPLEIRHRDGHITAVLYNASVYCDRNGQIMGVFAAARDITNLKRAEKEKDELEAQKRQLQKSESLGRMAASIAHHFNNQLGAVIGNLEMAMEELPTGASTHQTLTKAMQSAWTAADMSGLMLTYLGQTHNECESLDLSYFCRKILPLIKTTLPGNVVMETDFPLPRPIIMANTGEIQQILTNLITNALEATGNNKGIISLSVKTVSPIDIHTMNRFPVDWKSLDKTFACLEVTDTGCGIEDKDIEKLFDPFYSTKFTGRGMGLPVVMGLVNSYKGVITVDTKPGSGSSFRIFLPVSEEALAKSQMAEVDRDVTTSSPFPRKIEEGGTVLVVEDEEMLRDMAAAMLESFGLAVLKAKDGIEALEVFGKHQSEIQFVITDLTMPRMNGWETLTELRKLQPGIPVIMASGYDLAHVMEGDHPELPQAFLAKPYNLAAMRNAIRQVMEKTDNLKVT